MPNTRRPLRRSAVTGAAAAIVVGATAAFTAGSLPRVLMPEAPRARGLLVVEGWISPHALRLAADTFRAGHYQEVVVTGGPVRPSERIWGYATYADRGAARLRRLGIAATEIVSVPAPRSTLERTYRSAVAVRDWLVSSGTAVGDVDVFSEGLHTRRSRDTYRVVLGPTVAVGSMAAPPSYAVDRWWRSRTGVRDVAIQAAKYGAMHVLFWSGTLHPAPIPVASDRRPTPPSTWSPAVRP